MSLKTLAPIIGAIILVGCGSAPPRQALTGEITSREWSAPLNEVLSVEVGEALFVDGQISIRKLPAFRMSSAISSTMPGAYGIPFAFDIQQTDLIGTYQRGRNQFFCADLTRASASFPGLGVVVAEGDCIGVMKNVDTEELRWVVDNTNYNRGTTTVWSRPVKPSDKVDLRTYELPTDEQVSAQRFVFDGAYAGLLHFTLRGGPRNGTEFKFDYPSRNGDRTYGALGYVFEVVEVTNTTMRYRWLTIPNKRS